MLEMPFPQEAERGHSGDAEPVFLCISLPDLFFVTSCVLCPSRSSSGSALGPLGRGPELRGGPDTWQGHALPPSHWHGLPQPLLCSCYTSACSPACPGARGIPQQAGGTRAGFDWNSKLSLPSPADQKLLSQEEPRPALRPPPFVSEETGFQVGSLIFTLVYTAPPTQVLLSNWQFTIHTL